MSQGATRTRTETRLDYTHQTHRTNLPLNFALESSGPVRRPSAQRQAVSSFIYQILGMEGGNNPKPVFYSNLQQLPSGNGVNDKESDHNAADNMYGSHIAEIGGHGNDSLNAHILTDQRGNKMKRSNSAPLPNTNSSSPSAARRVIFPTLYESMRQTSPLCKNQNRVSPLTMNAQAALQPQSPPHSPSKEVPDACSTTCGAESSPSSSVSTISSVKHSLSQENAPLVSNKRTKQNGDLGDASDFSMELCHQDLPISYRPLEISSIPSTCTDSTDESSASTSPTVTDLLVPMSRDAPEMRPTNRSSAATPHHKVYISIPSLQHASPTSSMKDINPKKKLPGPSILRNRATVPVLTPTSPIDTPSVRVAPLSQDVDGSKLPNAKLLISCKRKRDLRKSLSESCIESLQSLSISDHPRGNTNDGDGNSKPSPPQNVILLPRASSSGDDALLDSSIYFTRHISHEEMTPNKRIRFDPRVWVHEIQRPESEMTWYTADDMKRFKREAILRIREWTLKKERQWGSSSFGSQMIATGTGRIITRGRRFPDALKKALYTSPALSIDAECLEEECSIRHKRQQASLEEFKTVLLVDCHDIFLKLLSKDIKAMLPHVDIVTAKSVEEALAKMEEAKKNRQTSHGFDLIVVENRLRLGPSRVKGGQTVLSGANLIQRIAFDAAGKTGQENRLPVVIGMSAYLHQDGNKLRDSGADFIWNKPPPKMDSVLRDKLLLFAMKKRHRKNVEELEKA